MFLWQCGTGGFEGTRSKSGSDADQSINQSINQSCISGLFHFILLPDHSWQIIEIKLRMNRGPSLKKNGVLDKKNCKLDD